MKSKVILVALASFTLLASCKKAQKDFTSPVTFQLQTQNASTGLVQWTAGNVNATAITYTVNQTGTPLNYQSTISQQANLFATTSLGSINLPSGSYANSSFVVTIASSGTTPAMHLEGTFNDGTNTVPITFDLTDSQMLQVNKDTLSMSGGAGYKAGLTLDLSMLMQGVAVTDLVADESVGQLNISATNNTALYNTLISNLRYALSINFQPM